jgi:hypothetical protein
MPAASALMPTLGYDTQAGIGKAGQTELSQWLAFLGKLSCLPDAIEGVSLGNATVVAFINRRS